MKLIMENWRKWLGLEKDFPSDGHSPVDDKVYSTHRGGVDPDLEKEGWTWDEERGEYFLHNPPRDRKEIRIDHSEGLPDELSRSLLDLDGHHFVKSDRDLNIPSLEGIEREMLSIEPQLTKLEAAETIDASRAEDIRQKMASFKQQLANSDTLDVDLLQMRSQLKTIENTLNQFEQANKRLDDEENN